MQITRSAHAAELLLAAPETDALVKNIGIPPRPATLLALQQEIALDDPDLKRVAQLVASDVTLSVALLRIVNSSAYGLSRRAETVAQAISLLGLKQVSAVVTGLVLRKVLPCDGPQLTRFWDVAGKRSHALVCLARGLRGGVDADVAQSFGLFCDVGIPLLMQRFPDYSSTLKACNDEAEQSFTAIEQARHHTDHALIGAMMARSWGLSQTVCLAIRLHHDYSIFRDPTAPEPVVRLVAMGLLAEIAIQRFARLNGSVEWDKGGDGAAGAVTAQRGRWRSVTLTSRSGSSGWKATLRKGRPEGLRGPQARPASLLRLAVPAQAQGRGKACNNAMRGAGKWAAADGA